MFSTQCATYKNFYGTIFLNIFAIVWGETNITENGCECVPFYLCANGLFYPNGKGIIDIRTSGSNQCSSYLEYCCDNKHVLLRPQTYNPPPPEKRGCGYRNPRGVGYNITGNINNETHFGEFPWMIAVFHKGENNSKHFFKCGWSLIHPQVVLTAAHCVTNKGSYRTRAGEWDRQTSTELFKHEDRDVVSTLIHPHFDSRNLQNDIALLFLQYPLELVAHINVVCLPSYGKNVHSSNCFVNGWGIQQDEGKTIPRTILKKIELPTITRKECQENFRKTRLGTRFYLHRSTMCAGGEEEKDSCKGDGGGPLVCPLAGEKERYQQVGIVSWGIGCGLKNVPGAYADVSYLRYWIDQQLSKKNVSKYIEYQPSINDE